MVPINHQTKGRMKEKKQTFASSRFTVLRIAQTQGKISQTTVAQRVQIEVGRTLIGKMWLQI
jgi:hypothetical protein